MILSLFFITVFAELLSLACVIFSLLCPSQRIWPPVRSGAWQSRLMGVLFYISGFGMILLGISDWNHSLFPFWLQWAIGAPLWLAGGGLALWALVTLGMVKSFGNDGEIIVRGPYCFSRNPQYVGFIVSLIGWGLTANSLFTLLAVPAGIAALVLAPFAEEAWLIKLHGPAYTEYMQSVPRFIGKVRHIRSAVL